MMPIWSKVRTAWRALRTVENWPLYFADYFGMTSGKQGVLKMRNGAKLKLRLGTNDRVIFNEIWLDKAYTPPGFELREGDTVFDIGAHIGLFALYAARNVRGSDIYAFEPEPQNFVLLEENKKLNSARNIQTIPKAVAERSGERELMLSESAAGHSFAYEETTTPRTRLSVPTVTLEDAMKECAVGRIDFLKLDCEGAEYEILFTAPHTILDTIRVISMEYHEIDNKRNAGALKVFLERNNFLVSIDGSRDMLHAKNLTMK